MTRFLYSVEIKPPHRPTERFYVSYDKLCGNRSGGCCSMGSKAELLAFLREVFRR